MEGLDGEFFRKLGHREPSNTTYIHHSIMITIAPNTINLNKTLIPPLHFAVVEKHVYCGPYPRSINFPFLGLRRSSLRHPRH